MIYPPLGVVPDHGLMSWRYVFRGISVEGGRRSISAKCALASVSDRILVLPKSSVKSSWPSIDVGGRLKRVSKARKKDMISPTPMVITYIP
jgi:hypothetical protein